MRSLAPLLWFGVAALAGCARRDRDASFDASATAGGSNRPAASLPDPGQQHATAALSGPAKARVGEPTGLTAVFTATEGFHCNREYPASFTPDAAPEGLSFASAKFAAVTWGETRSTIPVVVEATTRGMKAIAGTLKFGVCDEDACFPVKARVSFDLVVE